MKALLFLCAFSQLALAQTAKFLPENDLGKLDRVYKTSMTQAQFDNALNELEAYYTPLIKSRHGADLTIIHDWNAANVNAYATQIGSDWVVHMFGGLARRPEVTLDGLQLVACHELGHHLGGFPQGNEWAANEGQSDYFATLSCAKQLWGTHSKLEGDDEQDIASYPKHLCDASWADLGDRKLCYRVVSASKSLANLLAALAGHTVNYNTPDQHKVLTTSDEHPPAQCRLDTFLAGALCAVHFDDSVIPLTEEESAKVSCVQGVDAVGFRPRCWFKPHE